MSPITEVQAYLRWRLATFKYRTMVLKKVLESMAGLVPGRIMEEIYLSLNKEVHNMDCEPLLKSQVMSVARIIFW